MGHGGSRSFIPAEQSLRVFSGSQFACPWIGGSFWVTAGKKQQQTVPEFLSFKNGILRIIQCFHYFISKSITRIAHRIAALKKHRAGASEAPSLLCVLFCRALNKATHRQHHRGNSSLVVAISYFVLFEKFYFPKDLDQ